MCFGTTIRKEIFNPDIQGIPADYLKSISVVGTDNVENSDQDSLEDLLGNANSTVSQANKQNEKESRFRSIIDFSNFLLQVLSLKNNNIALDDKKLLDEFGCTYQSKKQLPDPIEFIDDLLFYRTCFDRYIIKREVGN